MPARLVSLLAGLLVAASPFTQVAAAARPPTKIAVLDVKATGTVDPRAVEGLSSLIASEVAGHGRHLRVISGADIRAMIGFEKQKNMLGCADTSCLAEIGGALGVDYIVGSEVSVVGGTWLLSLSLVHIATATPVSRLTKRTRSERELVDATISAVAELLGALPPPEKREEAPAAAVRAPEPSAQPEPPSGPSRVPALLVAGGALAAAGLGSYFLISAHGTQTEVENGTRLPRPTLTKARADALAEDGRMDATLGVSLIAGSAVLLGLSWLLWPSSEEAP